MDNPDYAQLPHSHHFPVRRMLEDGPLVGDCECGVTFDQWEPAERTARRAALLGPTTPKGSIMEAMTLHQLREFVELAERQGVNLDSPITVITNGTNQRAEITASNVRGSITDGPTLGIQLVKGVGRG